MIKVAINGFGRIGRTAFKVAVDKLYFVIYNLES